MHHFWVIARGGELDGEVGLLGLESHPTGEHLWYRGDQVADVPYVVTGETTVLPDGRQAYIAERGREL